MHCLTAPSVRWSTTCIRYPATSGEASASLLGLFDIRYLMLLLDHRVIAIYKSSECRSAIAVGNHRLAEKKSVSARDTANASLVWGIVAYIVYAVILWNQKIG